MNAQVAVTLAALVFIYLFHNERFYFVRNMFMVVDGASRSSATPCSPPRRRASSSRSAASRTPSRSFTGIGHDDARSTRSSIPTPPCPRCTAASRFFIGWSRWRRCCKHRSARDRLGAVAAGHDVGRRDHRQPLDHRRGPRRRDRGDLLRRRRLAARASGPPPGPSPASRPRATALMVHAPARRAPRAGAQPAHRVAPDAERDLADRLRAATSSPPCSSGERYFFLAGLAFIVGSVCDTLDGRYSRMSGKGTPFGAFLDSTLDRIEEGIVLTAVAAYFAVARRRVRGRRRASWRCWPR